MDLKTIPQFFILGRPRSGTTLLQAILNSHPNIVIPIESPFYTALRGKYERIAVWTSELLEQFYQDLHEVMFFNSLPVNREKLKSDIESMSGAHHFNELLALIYLNYEDYNAHEDITLFGDKNPVNLIYADRILKNFPESKIIYIYRDYRDNIESLLRMNFEAGIPALLAWRWKFTHKLIVGLKEDSPNRIYIIKYEALCEEPKRYTREICAFLDLPYQDELLDYHKNTDEAEKVMWQKSRDIHINLRKPVNTSRIGLWKERLTEKQIKAADMVAGNVADEAGYNRRYTRFSLFFLLRQQPILIYGKMVFFFMRNTDRFPRFIRYILEHIVPHFICIYNRLSGKSKQKSKSS